MTKETHARGGTIFSLILLPFISNQILTNYNIIYKLILIIIYIYFSYLGSLFPDIDMKGSYISKKFGYLHKLFGKHFRHRGFTHSLLFLVLLNILQSSILNYSGNNIVFIVLSKGFIVGYSSHILLDLITKEGVELIYPIQINFSLLPIKTSSKTEKFIYKTFNFFIVFLLGYRFFILFQ